MRPYDPERDDQGEPEYIACEHCFQAVEADQICAVPTERGPVWCCIEYYDEVCEEEGYEV